MTALNESPPRKRLLIVDDEQDLVEILAVRLDFSRLFDIDFAFDGPSALERVAAFHPDLVLIDVQLPGMSGWEVCRRLRATPAGAKAAVVVMTALSRSQVDEQAPWGAVDRVLYKPFEQAELLSALLNPSPVGAKRA